AGSPFWFQAHFRFFCFLADLKGEHMQEQAESVNILSAIVNLQSAQEYQELNWEGSFEDYLKLIQDSPRVTRNAFQRIYDMILSHRWKKNVEIKKKLPRSRFSATKCTTDATRFTESIKA